MAIFDFSGSIETNYSIPNVGTRYQPMTPIVFLDKEFRDLYPYGFDKFLNNKGNLSDDLYVEFNSLPYNTLRDLNWGPRELYRGQIYARGGGQMALEKNNYFNVPKKLQNRVFVSETYNSLPVRGWLYVPTTYLTSLDVLVLYHGTITSDGVTPYGAAEKFLNIATASEKWNITNKIIFSVAYPQDTVPSWNTSDANLNYQRAQSQFPGIDINSFYFGDNYKYAEASLLWVKNSINSFLSSKGFSKTINKVYMFGHSQGGGLVHKLNTVYTVDGVVANAPIPIDLVVKCTYSEQFNDSDISCSKLKSGFFSVSIEPDKYNSISLKNYLTGLKSPILYTQALDDTTGNNYGVPQVSSMQNIIQTGLSTCTNCAPSTFNYYPTGGHDAYISNTQLQIDVKNFIGA